MLPQKIQSGEFTTAIPEDIGDYIDEYHRAYLEFRLLIPLLDYKSSLAGSTSLPEHSSKLAGQPWSKMPGSFTLRSSSFRVLGVQGFKSLGDLLRMNCQFVCVAVQFCFGFATASSTALRIKAIWIGLGRAFIDVLQVLRF